MFGLTEEEKQSLGSYSSITQILVNSRITVREASATNDYVAPIQAQALQSKHYEAMKGLYNKQLQETWPIGFFHGALTTLLEMCHLGVRIRYQNILQPMSMYETVDGLKPQTSLLANGHKIIHTVYFLQKRYS